MVPKGSNEDAEAETDNLLPRPSDDVRKTVPQNVASEGEMDGSRFWLLRLTIALIATAIAVSLAGQHIAYRQQEKKKAILDQSTANVAPTILISLDGFRHDYLERKWREGPQKGEYIATTIRMLAKTGATTRLGMQPVFPSKTFPNHWSIATGLFPESSGITNNVMYDVKRKRYFHHSTSEPEWWHGEPIWQTLARFKTSDSDNNSTFKTATVFWPGSEVPGKRPSAFLKYDDDMPYKERVDNILSFFNGSNPALQDTKADFTTLYMHGVDHAGHAHGPFSLEVDKEIDLVDKAIARLLRKLGPSHATRYNIIIVSDHGMAEISEARVVNLTIPHHDALDVNISPLAEFIPKARHATALKLKEIIHQDVMRQGHGKAFLKSELPERWHLKGGEHVPPVLALVDVGWKFELASSANLETTHHTVKHHDGGLFHGHHPKNKAVKGDHGFDNTAHEMRSIFIANGPGFKNESWIFETRAVDVYATICKLFGVLPSPNNGSTRGTASLLA